MKDFSHGRFISVLGGTRHQPLVLAAGGLAEFERLLMDVLAGLSPQLLMTRRTGLLGTLELSAASSGEPGGPHLAQALVFGR